MTDLDIKGTIHTVSDDPIKVELSRGQKGTYGWTITVKGSNVFFVKDTIADIDLHLRTQYTGDTDGDS